MPNWFEKLVLSENKQNILNVIETGDISRMSTVQPYEQVVYTAYNEKDDKRIVKVKQSFNNHQPTDVIVWAVFIDARTGQSNSLNEANSLFARLAYKKIYKRYTQQR